jgi:hypothetical protein
VTIDGLFDARPEDLNDAQRSLYDALVVSSGSWADKAGFEAIAPDRSLLGPLNPLLFSPALGAAQIAVFHAAKATTSMPPRVHEVVILTVGAAGDSDYELYGHSATGKLAGRRWRGSPAGRFPLVSRTFVSPTPTGSGLGAGTAGTRCR